MNHDAMRINEFERVAMVHAGSLLRLALRLQHDHARAEDLVQETLLRAWRGFDQFERGTNCRAWLFRILINLSNKHWRKAQTAPQIISFEVVESTRVARLPAVKSHMEAAEVISALDTLTEERRLVLMLAVVEGFTCKEIARICEVPIGTVMSRLSRARCALRQALGYSKTREQVSACSK